jgi:hypothetical protein
MKKILLGIVVLVGIVCGIFYFLNKKEIIAPVVVSPVATNVNKIELCFYGENKTSRGLYDMAWLKMNIAGDKVDGEFRNLPAEKDSKVGTFEGTVGAVDKTMMARTADVWWDSMAEGMQVKEQLRIIFGEGNAAAGFGEMVDRGDGVYVYKDPTKLTYGMSMTDVACSDLNLIGRNCYEYNHTATASEPYTVHEKIDITKAGGKIIGTKSGTQTGPDMTNGYTGSLTGTASGDVFTAIYAYVVEGSAQKEKEIYSIQKDALVKHRYVLVDEKGTLVPDMTSAPKDMVYAKVSCN